MQCFPVIYVTSSFKENTAEKNGEPTSATITWNAYVKPVPQPPACTSAPCRCPLTGQKAGTHEGNMALDSSQCETCDLSSIEVEEPEHGFYEIFASKPFESGPRRQPSPRNKGMQFSQTVPGRSPAVWRPHHLLTMKIQENVFLPFPGN